MWTKRSLSLAGCLLSLIPASIWAFDSKYDGRLPVWPAEPVYLNGEAPPEARLFWEKNGPEFNLYWDHRLKTPRYVSPFKKLSVAGDLTGYRTTVDVHQYLEAAARRFIDENREFFGVSAAELSAPVIREINSEWLLSFRQVLSGLAVRGASLRVFLHADGSLESVKSFLWRERPGVEPAFIEIEPILATLSESEGYTFDSWEKEWLFTEYQPGSILPIWEAKGLDRDQKPVELFFDAATGLLLEKRLFAFELGVYRGDFHAAYPNPDRNDPEYNFLTPESFSPDQLFPVEGAMVTTRTAADFTGLGATFELTGTDENSRITWELSAGDCTVSESFDDGNNRFSFCPVIEGFYQVKKSLVVSDASYNPVFDPLPFLFKNGEFAELRENDGSKGPSTTNLSARLMVFQHAREFMLESEEVMRRLVSNLPEPPALRIAVRDFSDREKGKLVYHPDEYGPSIEIAPIFNREGINPNGKQLITPTILKHEYAHHVIFRLTGALGSVRFDCFNTEPIAGDPCLDKVTDPEARFEIAVIEGLADALSAYQCDTPLFGFYDSKGKTSGFMAYDISKRDPALEIKRNIVAKLFWEVFLKFRDDRNVAPVRKDRIDIAKRLVYHFIAKNNVAHGTDHTFDLSPILVEELLKSDDAKGWIGGDGDPKTPPPHQAHILNAFNDLDLVRAPFIRGDANQDGEVDMTDAINTLEHLFLGKSDRNCRDAMDANDSESIDISDPIHLLTVLFLGGPGVEIRPPFPGCGIDPTEIETFNGQPAARMSCNSFVVCPPAAP